MKGSFVSLNLHVILCSDFTIIIKNLKKQQCFVIWAPIIYSCNSLKAFIKAKYVKSPQIFC